MSSPFPFILGVDNLFFDLKAELGMEVTSLVSWLINPHQIMYYNKVCIVYMPWFWGIIQVLWCNNETYIETIIEAVYFSYIQINMIHEAHILQNYIKKIKGDC